MSFRGTKLGSGSMPHCDCDGGAAPCGRGSALLSARSARLDGDNNDAAGAALAFVPDGDGDGGAELWVGAPDGEGSDGSDGLDGGDSTDSGGADGGKHVAAVGSRLAAALHDLPIMFGDIQDVTPNVTRFFVLCASGTPAAATAIEQSAEELTEAP
jgi:hypothetical protein